MVVISNKATITTIIRSAIFKCMQFSEGGYEAGCYGGGCCYVGGSGGGGDVVVGMVVVAVVGYCKVVIVFVVVTVLVRVA